MGPRHTTETIEHIENSIAGILAEFALNMQAAEGAIRNYLGQNQLSTNETQLIFDEGGSLVITGLRLERTLRFPKSRAA